MPGFPEDYEQEPYENDLEEHEKNLVYEDLQAEDLEDEEECDCGDCDFCEAQALREFADPGGHSALRAASPSNPRNLPCPTCDQPNRLTPKDRELGYQCDRCADRAERGEDY